MEGKPPAELEEVRTMLADLFMEVRIMLKFRRYPLLRKGFVHSSFCELERKYVHENLTASALTFILRFTFAVQLALS